MYDLLIRMTHTTENKSPWRVTAANIVEELFPQAAAEHWDLLLDFRESLLKNDDWSAVVGEFSTCRALLEDNHYLPFYRLRCLLCAHLRLEGFEGCDLRSLLRLRQFPKALLRDRARLVECV